MTSIFPKPILYFLVVLLLVIAFAPIFWMVLTSLTPAQDMLTSSAPLLPENPTLNNYIKLLNPPPGNDSIAIAGGTKAFLHMILVTLFYAVATTLIALPLAVLASYSLAREIVPKKPLFITGALICYLLPPIAIVVPLFSLISNLGLYDTFFGIVLAYQVLVLPSSIWMLLGYFRNFPKELEEAAEIDGCSRLSSIFRVVIPVAAPAITAIATFCIMVIWQEFTFAMVLVKDDNLRNVQVGLQYFFQPGSPVDWGVVMAASTIIALPTAFLFAYVQQFFVEGLFAGAVKG